MKTTVRYTGTRAEKEMAALTDANEYLGQKKVGILRDHIASVKQDKGIRFAFRAGYFCLSFAGVQGLPARAFIRNTIRQNPMPEVSNA